MRRTMGCLSYATVSFLCSAFETEAVFLMPPPTHGDGMHLEPYHVAWDAIGGLGPGNEDVRLKGKWADLLPSIPEGKNYLYHTDRMDGLPLFGWRRRYWSFLLKLAKDKPSWTI